MTEFKLNGINEMFDFYKAKYKNKLMKLEVDKAQYEELLKTFNDVEVDTPREVICERDVTYWGKLTDKRLIFKRLKRFCELYNKVKALEKRMNEKGARLNKDKFSFIIDSYNTLGKIHLIKGHHLQLNTAGGFYIKRVNRKTWQGRANPVKSGKNRYQLLEDGLIPKCLEAPNGHPWIEFYNDPHRPVVMWKTSVIRMPKEIKKQFVFVPVTGENSLVTQIYEALKKDPTLGINYIR